MNYISLGYDCSTASILRDLGLRKYALPFDWIRTTPLGIYLCITDNFEQFHKNLELEKTKSCLVDKYGFDYPHDYPTIFDSTNEPGDGHIGEATIIDGWEKYHEIVLEKYRRRIERFHNLLNSQDPIIALFFGKTSDVYMFKAAFLEKYNKTNIIYIVYSYMPSNSDDIFTCDGSKSGWINAIKEAENRSKHLNGLPL